MAKPDTRITDTIWNVPNRLSMARLLISCVVFVCIPSGWYWTALILFVFAAGTDWVDGWWARRYDQVTQLGRILDPFCDKFLICGSFILLAVEMHDFDFPWYASITGWVAVIVVAREMLVTGIRSFIEQSGGDFSAKMIGKLKMVFQCVAVGACLVALGMVSAENQETLTGPAGVLPSWILVTLIASVWLTVVATLVSGAQYVVAAIGMIDRNSGS